MGSGFNRDFNWIISVWVNIELDGCACGSGGDAPAVGVRLYHGDHRGGAGAGAVLAVRRRCAG